MAKRNDELADIIKGLRKAIDRRIDEIGREAVEVARRNGTYHDVTGRLRRSTEYRADDTGLTIYNTAPYADEVSARGHDVIDSATAYAREELERMDIAKLADKADG